MKRRDVLTRAARLGALGLVTACGGQTAGPSPTRKVRRIGYLGHTLSNAASIETRVAFVDRLRELGYIDGQNVVVEFRFTENDIERLPGLAAELAGLPVDVLLTTTGPPSRAGKDATTSIPIVFVQVTDPIAQGLVTDLARPGGNVTGISTASLPIAAKRVELLKQAFPQITRVSFFWNANMVDMAKLLVPTTEDTARALGVATRSHGVHNPEELDKALEVVAKDRPDAVLMLPAISVVRSVGQVPDFAQKLRLPQIYSDVQMVRAGGLMHIGPNYVAQYRRAADFVDRILKGGRPADIPIEQASQFDFVVNLAAAERIGVTIPEGVLRQATEVIQ